jgi:pimeloyl-ACP methyl ester carboxylesterase
VANWLNTPIETQFRVIDGLSIRFAESGKRDDHALLLSPWPESLLAFEPMWSRLAERTHLVAIDLPGFGRSQRRDALLSPSAMGEFIVRAADAFGLGRPHVIGPDIGTAAALFAAAARLPDRRPRTDSRELARPRPTSRHGRTEPAARCRHASSPCTGEPERGSNDRSA